MKKLKIILIASVLSAFLAVQGFGQANLVSATLGVDYTGDYLGVGYEHLLKNYFSLSGDIGYSWTNKFAHAWWTKGDVYYYQMKFRVAPRYYFLLHRKVPGQGIFGQIFAEAEVHRSLFQTTYRPQGVFYRGMGVGIGANWTIWKGVFAGIDGNFIYSWLNGYEVLGQGNFHNWVQTQDWRLNMYLRAGWNFGWKKPVRK